MSTSIGYVRWGGPKRENRTERDRTGKCYRWLAKGDLITKTGYGYAKCLTVAGTATSAPSKRCLSSNIQKQLSNKTDQDKEKTEQKERNKRGYLAEKTVV